MVLRSENTDRPSLSLAQAFPPVLHALLVNTIQVSAKYMSAIMVLVTRLHCPPTYVQLVNSKVTSIQPPAVAHSYDVHMQMALAHICAYTQDMETTHLNFHENSNC
jgi:hypothetical protein